MSKCYQLNKFIFLIGIMSISPQLFASETEFADTVIQNASIYTVNNEQPWAEALAIKNGKYIYVGENSGVHKYIGDTTKLISVNDGMVMPGIIDAHIHPAFGGIKELYECNFPFTATPQEISKTLKQCIRDNPIPTWLFGGQWDSGFFDRYPEISPREFLDKVSLDKAIILNDDSLHNTWVNSKAFALTGITERTKNPEGGSFERDPKTNKLNGIIHENATKLMARYIPKWKIKQYKSAIQHVIHEGHKFGIIGMKDAGAPITGMAAYNELDKAGLLNMHIATSIRTPDTHREQILDYGKIDSLRDKYKSDNVHTAFVKIFMDGVPTSSHTAAMLAPYVNKPGEIKTSGSTHLSAELLAIDLTELDKRGYTVKIHTAGDRSVKIALDAIEITRKANGYSGLRHELAHAGYIDESDIKRFSELEAVADLSPYLWHPSPIINAIISAVGEPRASKHWPIKSLLEAKAPLLAGSDWPAAVASVNPWFGIEAMVSRADPRGDSPGTLWSEQAIGLDQVLRIFTLEGAKALRIEDTSGSIEVGKSADLLVINSNLFKVNTESISDTEIEMTLFSGEIVYQK